MILTEFVTKILGETYEIRNDLVVRPFRTRHVIPSQVSFIRSFFLKNIVLIYLSCYTTCVAKYDSGICHLFSEKQAQKTVRSLKRHANQEIEAFRCSGL